MTNKNRRLSLLIILLVLLMAIYLLLTSQQSQPNTVEQQHETQTETRVLQDSINIIKPIEVKKRQEQDTVKQQVESKQSIDTISKKMPKVKQRSKAKNSKLVYKKPDEIKIARFGFVFIPVQGGVFQMGEGQAYKDLNRPIRTEKVSDFNIGKYEVTQMQWAMVMRNFPSKSKGDTLPVEMVSWNDIQIFLTKLNKLTGKVFRLPTDTEWEYAARGGRYSKAYKYVGSNTIGEVAWYKENSNYKSHNVDTKKPNELGIYNMAGNVSEWCSDDYDLYNDDCKITRGGCMGSAYINCTAASWICHYPDTKTYFLGFRLVLED